MSHLPSEIERHIFEIAAEESFSSIPRFCRVACRVNSWLRPMLYRVLQIQSSKVVPPVYHYDYTSRSKGQGHPGALELDFDRLSAIAPLIKVIMVQAQSSNIVISILKRCTSVEDLTLWMVWMESNDFVPSLPSLPHLKRLSIDPTNIFASEEGPMYIPKIPALFDNITHLEVPNCTDDWFKWDDLGAMPHLTHVALHAGLGFIDQQMCSQVMLACKGLKVLILSSYRYRGFRMELDEGSEVLVRVRAGGDDAPFEWEDISQRRADWLWVQAAELMRKRLASRCREAIDVS